jgi:hypothetical protein
MGFFNCFIEVGRQFRQGLADNVPACPSPPLAALEVAPPDPSGEVLVADAGVTEKRVARVVPEDPVKRTVRQRPILKDGFRTGEIGVESPVKEENSARGIPAQPEVLGVSEGRMVKSGPPFEAELIQVPP